MRQQLFVGEVCNKVPSLKFLQDII